MFNLHLMYGDFKKEIFCISRQAVSSSRLAASASLSTSSSMRDQHEADLVVIGSGPGGYVGAIKAAQLGMKVN